MEKDRIFLVFKTVFSNKKKRRKEQAASKKEAGGDAKHVLFFTSPNIPPNLLTEFLALGLSDHGLHIGFALLKCTIIVHAKFLCLCKTIVEEN